MNTRSLTVLLGGVLALLIAPAGSAGSLTPRYLPTVLATGPHSRLVEQVWVTPDETGQSVLTTNTYVELTTGMNRWLAAPNGQGSWVPAVAEFEQTADGHCIARQTQHSIILPPDLSKEPVDMLCPDGVTRLISAPYGVSLLDLSTGEAVLIGQLKSCTAELVSPTTVVYRDCLEGLSADLVYDLSLASLEQNLVLRAQPPDPKLLQMDGDHVRIQMLTEFFDPPSPARQTRLLKVEPDGWKRQNFVAPDLADTELNFGGVMAMDQGRAFVLGNQATGAPVGKSLETLAAGRHFLIESCDYSDLGPMLSTLPVKTEARAPAKYRMGRLQGNWRGLSLPPAPQDTTKVREARARFEKPGEAMRRAQAGPQTTAWLNRPGVILDYVTLNSSQTDWVFTNTVTYYASGPVILYTNAAPATVFEEGTVIKFAPTNSAKLTVKSPIAWQGTAYHPVVLTAADDASVGDAVGSGTLTNYYAVIALDLDALTANTNITLQHFRIAHAKTAIAVNGKAGHVFSHGQFVNCQNGISPTNSEFSLRNALFHNVLTNFNGSSSTGRCEHVTVNTAVWFNYNGTCNPMTVTNSLLAGVANVGTNTSVGTVTLASAAGVFQSAGTKGANYLADNSPYRDYATGSTGINSALWQDLKRMTTYPPITLTGDFTVNTTLSPQAGRDTDTLDLGYHYCPLDYVWSGLNLTNATLTLTNGTTVGIYGIKGTSLKNGAKLYSEGGLPALARMVRYHAVQEQPEVWGATGSSFSFFDVSGSPSPLPEVRLRFTDLPLMADAVNKRTFFGGAGGGVVSTLALTDCQLRGAYLNQSANYAGPMTVALTNNIVQRSSLSWYQENISGYYAFTLNLYNNLFRLAAVSFNDRYTNWVWTVKDNLFDTDSLVNSGTVPLTASNNGYRSGVTSLGGANNKTGLVMDYQGGLATNWFGALGMFYYPTNGAAGSLTNLINTGSRLASAAGLYHYTTTTNQVKEAVSQVDIGFHYVAADLSTFLPLDADGDGLPDYVEDRNGDGSLTSGETDWQDANNGISGAAGLQVFTPLHP